MHNSTRELCTARAMYCRGRDQGLTTSENCGHFTLFSTMLSLHSRAGRDNTTRIIKSSFDSAAPGRGPNPLPVLAAAARRCRRWHRSQRRRNDVRSILQVSPPATCRVAAHRKQAVPCQMSTLLLVCQTVSAGKACTLTVSSHTLHHTRVRDHGNQHKFSSSNRSRNRSIT